MIEERERRGMLCDVVDLKCGLRVCVSLTCVCCVCVYLCVRVRVRVRVYSGAAS
jgi:hypothetical protein